VLRFSSLGSGSSGNACLIQTKQALVMLDCGFSCKETVLRLKRIDVDPKTIDAIVVTHEHNDHFSGVGTFSRKFKVPIWMNYGTYRSKSIGKLEQLTIFDSNQSFYINDLHLQPFPVPHDSREAVQFIFSCNNKKLAIVTDLGHVSVHVKSMLKEINALVIEANHDYDMLWAGGYSQRLKHRVSGNYGHLNNHQAAELVKSLDYNLLQHLIVAHLSSENNTPEKTRATFEQVLNIMPKQFEIANQSKGYSWKDIN
jgi:phosphoribosyl 1,2-cyclic phosphodiesterase